MATNGSQIVINAYALLWHILSELNVEVQRLAILFHIRVVLSSILSADRIYTLRYSTVLLCHTSQMLRWYLQLRRDFILRHPFKIIHQLSYNAALYVVRYTINK
jgi:hypothetical protein